VNSVNADNLIDAVQLSSMRSGFSTIAKLLIVSAIFICAAWSLGNSAQASESVPLVLASDVGTAISARGYSRHHMASAVDVEVLAPNWLNKLLAPLSELPNPIDLLRSAHIKAAQIRASQWQMLTGQSWRDSAEVFDAANARILDISMVKPRALHLRRQRSRLMNLDSMTDGLAAPTMDASMPWVRTRPATSPYRRSATQLQVRMDDGMSLLWELDRGNSLFSGEELGIGVGFRLSF
jgi:hypothetical protein